jgi:hypothetical protein
VTSGLQRQIAGLFVAEERGTHALKGVESKAAFIRARELAAAIDNATERFTIYYGPRRFCARLNGAHGRRSVGLAAAYWEPRASGRVISSRRKRSWLRR